MSGRERGKGLASVIGLTLVWGTSWVLFPLALRELSVWTFRVICLLGAGSLLLCVARLRGLSLHVPKRERLGLALAGIVYLATWNIGTAYASILIPSGQAAVLGFTMPLWATLITWAVLGERPSKAMILGVVLAACGVLSLAFAARHSYASAPLGFVLGLTAAIGWALGTIILKRTRVTVPPIVSAGWQLLIAGVPILAVALATGSHQWLVPSPTSMLAIGYVVLVPMAMGNIAWFSIAESMPPAVSGLSTTMVPMVAMVAGAFFRHEPLGATEVTAMALCGASLLLVLARRSA